MSSAQVFVVLFGRRLWSAAAHRVQRPPVLRPVDPATYEAADRRAPLAGSRWDEALRLHLLPDAIAIDEVVGGDHRDHERCHGIQRHAGIHLRNGAKAGKGDEHAEQEHLDHRPRADPAVPLEDGWEKAGRLGRTQAELYKQQHEDLCQWCDDRGEGHDQRQFPGALFREGGGEGQHRRLALLPHDVDREEWRGHGHDIEHERGQRQRQNPVRPVPPRPPQRGVAAQAVGLSIARHWRQPLKQAAVRTLPFMFRAHSLQLIVPHRAKLPDAAPPRQPRLRRHLRARPVSRCARRLMAIYPRRCRRSSGVEQLIRNQ